MFTPPFCPRPSCSQHQDSVPHFFILFGTYSPKCRARPVQRYRCRSCKLTFSRQTFRSDYRDHKPYLNASLFQLVSSGIGIRQCSRLTGLSLRCTELKLRKLGRHAEHLNKNILRPLQGAVEFHLDEFETYESQRNARPLTVPMLILSESRYIVWSESAPIRPRGKMTQKRLEDIRRSEERHGHRIDQSRESLVRTLDHGAKLAAEADLVVLSTDEKSTYPGLAKKAFRAARLVHKTTNSKLARDTLNPLFPINHEEAMVRDLMGRLRRESWLVSKDGGYLNLALQLHAAHRNLVRRRFNRDKASAAEVAGLMPRRLKPHEVLSWRQIWGKRSVHPLSADGSTIERWEAHLQAAA